MASSRTATQSTRKNMMTMNMKQSNNERRTTCNPIQSTRMSKKKMRRPYVGVSSRSELLNPAVRSNIFNAVSEGSFVHGKPAITTTTTLLQTTFRLHQNINTLSRLQPWNQQDYTYQHEKTRYINQKNTRKTSESHQNRRLRSGCCTRGGDPMKNRIFQGKRDESDRERAA